MGKISIVIIDDHQLAREAWETFLNLDTRFEVKGASSSVKQGLELIRAYGPDIVLLDINLPDVNGIDATKLIMTQAPKTKVVGLSTHQHPEYAKSMIRKGAMGYVSKYDTRDELLHAIIEVADGKKYICKTVKDIVARDLFESSDEKKPLALLTSRELEIIQMIKKGLTSKEIAVTLYLAVKTIEVHRYNILKKLGLKNSAALINYINRHIIN